MVHLVSKMRDNVWDFTEHFCRSILFLGPSKQSDWLLALSKKESLQDEFDGIQHAYHAAPRREHYLNIALKFLFLRWYQPIFKFRRWCQKKITWFLFFRAKEFEYCSYHYIKKSGNIQIDGYLSFRVCGLKRRVSLDICGLDCLKYDAQEWNFKSKKDVQHYIDLNSYGSYGFSTLLVPKRTFNVKDIEKTVSAWYKDQVAYRYRHWTSSGIYPKISFSNFYFEEDCCGFCYKDLTRGEQHTPGCRSLNKPEENT